LQERWFERDAEFLRVTPMETAAKQASGSKIEITINAMGRQSMSPLRAPVNRDKVGHSQDAMNKAARNNAV
jgi:hypothetical protein